jgi:acyl carrier protein
MIPQHWFTIEKWPLTSNGKIDRKALPKVDSHHHDQLEELSGDTQLGLAAIWQEVLKLEKIGANSHFFRLGGHSLTATRVNTRIRKHFALELPLRAIFEFPVLADLAQHLDELSSPSGETSDHLEIEI